MKALFTFIIGYLILSSNLAAQCNASFTWTQTQNNVIAFTNASTPTSAGMFWDFGDQQTSSQISPTHTYFNPGTYQVCLAIVDSFAGCVDIFCDTIVVTGNPTVCAANFTWVQTGPGIISFTNTSTPSTSGYSFSWNFGNSQTSPAVSPVHTYASPGTYIVCLTMFNTSNCQSTYCDTIQVTGTPPPPCQAAFTFTQNGAGVVQFTNTSLPSTAGYFFSWNFGNSQGSLQVSPSATYAASGSYIVCLTMVDSTCQSTVCDTIQVIISGTSELDLLGWSLYPNPANDVLNVQTAAGIRGMQYHILDISGREVYAGVFSESRISVGDLLPGVYLLSVRDESGKVSTQRFMKQ
ncbi:MAG: PKD domain-containing protein [Bacteroidia bacterium]|jgi:PKD repeat protein|nr:PKD domain-containing protein [Bacteroidia bacterium]